VVNIGNTMPDTLYLALDKAEDRWGLLDCSRDTGSVRFLKARVNLSGR